MLDKTEPGKFEFSEDREFADYIYSAEKLETLSGKKLHAKRNYVNRFCAGREWSFRELEQGDFPACLELLRHWHEGEQDEDIIGEHEAIVRCFEHYGELDLAGGVLFVDGELAAFAVGERISADTADVHFEKAVAGIDGAYAMINRELVRLMRARWPELEYINREDDMGLENLRQAKLSYPSHDSREPFKFCSLFLIVFILAQLTSEIYQLYRKNYRKTVKKITLSTKINMIL